MKRRFFIPLILSLVIVPAFVFAGVEWQSTTASKSNGKESTVVTHGYAQKGNIREDFVKSTGAKNPMYKKGSYFLYKANTNIVYIVNTEDKTYTEMSIESLSQTLGAVIQMKISNPKVDVQKLTPEAILSYNCRHISISSSYDLETKIAFITAKSHIDQTQELWGSDAVAAKEFSDIYKSRSFKTSFKDLDNLIQKQTETLKNLGFVLKSVTTQKSTGEDKKTQESVSTMTVDEINVKNLGDDLFKIPAGYKKEEMKTTDGNETKEKKDGSGSSKKNEDVKAEDLIKGLFK